MPKLNQVNAILTSKKSEVEKEISEIYKTVQKDSLFNGKERSYRPNDENGQKLPSESQRVQQRVSDLLRKATNRWQEVWALVVTQDTGNQSAVADIIVEVDGQRKTIAENVPVTTLLYLDKQLNDIETFVSKLPTPDPAEEWNYDASQRLLRSKTSESIKTAKEQVAIVKYPATAQHPAQTEMITKDNPVGTWTQYNYSGAIQADQKESILLRVRKLQAAVKEAREGANMQEVERKNLKSVLEFAFGKEVFE